MAFHIEQAEFENREQAEGPRADNNNVSFDRLAFVICWLVLCKIWLVWRGVWRAVSGRGRGSRAPTDTRWMSFQSRPDSCPSGLPLRRSDGQPLKLIAHLDLARQPRIWFHVVGKIEHIFFHRRRLANFFSPRLFDVDVASRTRARSAAFGLDAWHTVLDCSLHQCRAVFALDGARRAFRIDEGDFGHGRPAIRG